MMKKLMLGLFMSVLGVFSLATITPVAVHAQGWVQTEFGVGQQAGGVAVGGGTEQDQQDNILAVFKNVINYALGFLGLIALVMLLWAGFWLVTARDNAEKYKTALSTFKNAALGIALIAVSWFLVTFIFFVLWLVTN